MLRCHDLHPDHPVAQKLRHDMLACLIYLQAAILGPLEQTLYAYMLHGLACNTP